MEESPTILSGMFLYERGVGFQDAFGFLDVLIDNSPAWMVPLVFQMGFGDVVCCFVCERIAVSSIAAVASLQFHSFGAPGMAHVPIEGGVDSAALVVLFGLLQVVIVAPSVAVDIETC